MARRNVVGRFPSTKLNRMVKYHSTIERDLIYWLDYASLVKSFKEQPFPIHYRKDGKTRKYRYTPDFYVETVGGQRFVIECKPQSKVDTDENKAKFAVAKKWCVEDGSKFVIVTDDYLREGHWLENVKLLTEYSRYRVPDEFEAMVKVELLARSLTVGEVSQTPYLYSLIYQHKLYVPLFEAPISAETPIFLQPVNPPIWLP